MEYIVKKDKRKEKGKIILFKRAFKFSLLRHPIYLEREDKSIH